MIDTSLGSEHDSQTWYKESSYPCLFALLRLRLSKKDCANARKQSWVGLGLRGLCHLERVVRKSSHRLRKLCETAAQKLTNSTAKADTKTHIDGRHTDSHAHMHTKDGQPYGKHRPTLTPYQHFAQSHIYITNGLKPISRTAALSTFLVAVRLPALRTLTPN